MDIASLLDPPLLVADTGSAALAEPDSEDLLTAVPAAGATAIRTTLRETADGAVILRQPASVPGRFRRRPVASVRLAELPDDTVTLDRALDLLQEGIAISAYTADENAAVAAVTVARAARRETDLWLVHDDLELLSDWRHRFPDVRLINSAVARNVKGGLERRASKLRDVGVDGLELHRSEWTGGYTTMVHRFGRIAWALDAEHEREAEALLRMGVDAVCGPHPARLREAADRL